MYNREKIALLEKHLPAREETQKRMTTYLDRSGLTLVQFAGLTGYAVQAIRLYKSGTYHVRGGTDVPIRDAIETAMRRYPVGLPSTEAEGTLYETENVADLRQWFHHCHEHRALAFCYGPPGSQKTFVLKHLVAEFNRRELARPDATNRAYYIYVSDGTRPRDLVAKMCRACGASTGGSFQSCMASLRVTLRQTQAVFVLDESQHLSIHALEAVRELYDEEPRIGALLAGSHTLKQLFDRRASELEQWNSRLDAGIELKGVSEQRARLILAAELPQLSAVQVTKLIDGARVADAYSRTNTSYLNVRRLFKNIEAFQQLDTVQKGRAA